MAIKAPLLQAAKKLLTPHSQLTPFLFDADEKMLEDKRLAILKIVNFIIKKTLNKIDGIAIEDICLVGSLASIYYHEDSDLDVIVVVKNKNCPFLHKDPKKLFYFTEKLCLNMFPREVFSLNGKSMDIILKTIGFGKDDKDRFSNAYSILNNRWIRYYKPAEIIPPHINMASLIQTYYQSLVEINAFLKDLKIEKECYTREQATNLIIFYNSIINRLKLSSRLSNLTYKLLRSQNKIQDLGYLAALALRNSLQSQGDK